MPSWAKVIIKENTLSPIDQLEKYRSDYLYDPRHLDVAELKWDKLYLSARALQEDINNDHYKYYKFAAQMGYRF